VGALGVVSIDLSQSDSGGSTVPSLVVSSCLDATGGNLNITLNATGQMSDFQTTVLQYGCIVGQFSAVSVKYSGELGCVPTSHPTYTQTSLVIETSFSGCLTNDGTGMKLGLAFGSYIAIICIFSIQKEDDT